MGTARFVLRNKTTYANLVLTVGLFYIVFYQTQDLQKLKAPLPYPTSESRTLERYGVDIWITMGLCWSNNTHYWGKDQFPYKEAAPLSSRLWMNVTGARVVLQVVYAEPQPTPELLDYKAELEGHGVLVKLIPKADNVKCVLEAQLIRMLAYLLPEVKFFSLRNLKQCLLCKQEKQEILLCNRFFFFSERSSCKIYNSKTVRF